MGEKFTESRKFWLVMGIFIGMGIAYLWPHEPVYAVATDRDAQFAMTTCNVTLIDPIEGLFVVDFLTGSLKGAVLNRQRGKFMTFYYRNLAADFNINPKNEPHYAMVTGLAQIAGKNGITPASSVIYVGELTTGKVVCYGFVWRDTNTPIPVMELSPIDIFQFREPSL